MTATATFDTVVADMRARINTIAKALAPHRAKIIYSDPAKLSVDAYATRQAERLALETRVQATLDERAAIMASRHERTKKTTTELRMAETAWGEIMHGDAFVTADMFRNFYDANRKRRDAMEYAVREERCPVYVSTGASAAAAPESAKKKKTPPQGKTNYIKDAIVWTDFKFKTFDECASLKRSAKTYMSKDDILEVIRKRPSLKKRMPAGYSSASKEALCKVIFDMQ